ncbi:MAG: lipopolysaccharide biosynthesis protein [Chakrabartia sp.]
MTDETQIRAGEITSHDVAKGAGTTLLARLGAVVEVVAQPAYVWLFGLAGYGIYTALWAAITLVQNIANLGMTSALQRTVPQASSEQEAVAALRAAMTLGVAPCLVLALLATIFGPHLAHIFNAAQEDAARLAHFIALFAWALPLWAFVEVGTSALRARRVFGAEIRLRLFWEQVVRLAIAFAFSLGAPGTIALFYAHLASLLVICGLCLRLLARNFDLSLLMRGPGTQHIWRDTWLAGISVMPANLVARLFSDAPTLALNAMLPGAEGAVAGAQFALARKVSSIVQTIRLAFAYVLSPLASAASTGGKQAVADIYGFATRVSLAVALPVSLVMIAGGPVILRAIGQDMETATMALALLLLARLAEAVIGAAAPIQQVVSRYSSQYLGSVLGLLIAFALVAALMPDAGLTGMSIAVACGLVITSAVPVWQLRRQDGIHPFAAPFAQVALRAMLVSLIGFVLGLASNLLPLAIALPLLILLLLASLWASCRFALPRVDRGSLGAVGRRLRLA